MTTSLVHCPSLTRARPSQIAPRITAALLGAVVTLAAVLAIPAIRSVNAPEATPLSVGEAAARIGAATMHDVGIVGRGVRVAIIDSGIATVPALDGVVERFGPRPADDVRGHGTHLAGIVHTVAPGATIVDLAAADPDGSPSVSGVDAALHRLATGVVAADVVLLAADLAPGPSEQASIEASLARLASAGVAVVAAAGNQGGTQIGLDWPATSPHVISVGAVGALGDGWEVPSWTAIGDARRGPDVVAPGRSIESLLAPGSAAATDPGAVRIGDDMVRGSGTSQSAAMVAGAVALLSEAAPTAAVDQVLVALMQSARPVAEVAPMRQGAGVIDVAGAAALLGVADAWTGHSWTGHSWTGHSWTGHSWTGHSWTGHSWTGHSWT